MEAELHHPRPEGTPGPSLTRSGDATEPNPQLSRKPGKAYDSPRSVIDAGAFAPALGSIVLVDQAVKAVLVAAIPEGTAIRLGSLGRIRPSRNPAAHEVSSGQGPVVAKS
jgi:hypothetical protein